MINPLPQFSEVEMTDLRENLVAWIAGNDRLDAYLLSSNTQLYTYINSVSMIRTLLEMPFNEIPLKINLCPPGVNPEWWSIPLKWRLKIGK